MSYNFDDKPTVTYVGNLLHIATTTTSIDYPLDDLEKITFGEGIAASVDMLTVTGAQSPIQLYDINGKLLRQASSSEDRQTEQPIKS